MEMFISGRKHETSYVGLLEYGCFQSLWEKYVHTMTLNF